jgi:hypothetical protein
MRLSCLLGGSVVGIACLESSAAGPAVADPTVAPFQVSPRLVLYRRGIAAKIGECAHAKNPADYGSGPSEIVIVVRP